LYSSSALQSFLLTFELSKSPFQLSQFSVLERLSGTLSSSCSAEGQSTICIWQILNTWVRSPGRFFADKAGGKGDHSDNANAAAPLC
jgi:hypothetical protein